MDIKQKMDSFNKRWNISSNKTYQEEYNDFRRRVMNIFSSGIDNLLEPGSINVFCQFFAICRAPGCIREYVFEKDKTESEFYKCIEFIFSLEFAPENYGAGKSGNRKKLEYYIKVENALYFSQVNLAMTLSQEPKGELNIILYPKGEELLDKVLVNQPLSFLEGSSSKHFQEALSFYQDKNWIKSGESVRRSIEEYLKFKLKNEKGLDKNIQELMKKLKGIKSPTQFRNILSQNLTYLNQFFNDNTKHNDGDINEYDVEYLIYQVGVLMRYISKTL